MEDWKKNDINNLLKVLSGNVLCQAGEKIITSLTFKMWICVLIYLRGKSILVQR